MCGKGGINPGVDPALSVSIPVRLFKGYIPHLHIHRQSD
jgi:hypothetical protein